MPTQKNSTTGRKASPTPRRPRSTPATVAPQQAPTGPQTEDRYAPTVWGSAASQGGPQDLEMPSGQVALVRKPGLSQLMAEGVLHRMDSLTALVDKKFVRKGRPGTADSIDVSELFRNTEALADILHTVDRVVCACVIKPHVEMAPNDITSRKQGVIYADTIDINDKMFIFNWVIGGTQDLESFRRESEAAVGSLSVGEPLQDEAE